MFANIYKPSHREGIFMILILSPLLYLYHHDIERLPFQLQASLRDGLAFKDSKCTGMRVIKACAKEEPVKVLFIVDTTLEGRARRRFARNSYASRNFAHPIRWLTVFRMMGNVTDQGGGLEPKVRAECRSFGDIVVNRNSSTGEIFELEEHKNTSSYLQFVPWILENCPRVDLVVLMQDKVIPHPFYLPHYRVMHMDHRPEVIHCHGNDALPTSSCEARSVVMVKNPGLAPFANNASQEEGRFILNGLKATDMRSYLAVDEMMPMLYTVGAVVFFEFPQRLNVTMRSLWEEMMDARENSPDFLRL